MTCIQVNLWRMTMKRKVILCMVLSSALVLLLAGQTTKITRPPVTQVPIPKLAPLKIGIMAQSPLDGNFSLTVNLQRSGKPVSGATIYCGSALLKESNPGYYRNTGSCNIPVNPGQVISFSISDGLPGSYTATAKIKDFARITKPVNGEAVDRNQGGLVIQWSHAAGSSPAYLLVNSHSAPGFHFSQDNLTGNQFTFPLSGVPAAADTLGFVLFCPTGLMNNNDFTFTGNVTADSRGNVQLYDSVYVNLK